MSDSVRPGDSEDEVLDRIEAALRKIAAAPRASAVPAMPSGTLDRAALVQTLDMMIARLKAGLNPPGPATTE